MSLSFQKLEPVLVQDPVSQVTDTNSYAVLSGGSKISFKAYTSTSISSSSIQFSCPPPSANIIVNRNVLFTLPIRLTFSGLVATSNAAFAPVTSLLNQGLDAPRAFPISSMLETLQCNINNDSISIPMSDVIHPLTRYNIDQSLRNREYSTTPCYPDQSFNYQDLVGTVRNPLGNYGNSLEGGNIGRGGFPFTIVSNPTVVPTVAGTPATAVVDFWCTEELFLSPFFWGKASENMQGFYNVNSMDFNLSFLAQAGFRCWSHANVVTTSGTIQVTSTISTIAVQFSSFSPAFSYAQNFPQMQFQYLTPNILTPDKLGPNIPVTYPYFNVQRYVTDISTIAYGNPPAQLSTNNIQLNSIPRRIYLFARPNNASLTSRCDLTDCYLQISNIAVQWANQNTLLSSASMQQLYQINVKNHSSQDWNSWSGFGLQNSAFTPNTFAAQYGGVGSVLCLEMGTDIQLDSSEAPGLSGNSYQLQISVNLANMNSSGAWDNVPMALYVIVVSEGTFTITGTGSAQHQDAVLSRNDIIDAQSRPGINYRMLQSLNGGDFLSSLRNFAGKVNDFFKQSKIISTVASAIPHPISQGIAQGAKALGYGVPQMGGVAIQGGRRMSKKELRSRL